MLCIVSAGFPSSGLEVEHRLFFWIPYSLRNLLVKFHIFFSTGWASWEPVQPVLLGSFSFSVFWPPFLLWLGPLGSRALVGHLEGLNPYLVWINVGPPMSWGYYWLGSLEAYCECLAWAHLDVWLKMLMSIDLPLFAVLGWGPEVRTWLVGNWIHLMHRTWICLLVMCLYCLTNLLCSAWLGTSGTHLFWFVETKCTLDIEQVRVIYVICLAWLIDWSLTHTLLCT